MRDRFGARDPRSMMLRFHVQTAGSTLTAQQPDVNIVRTALQAMAAVLGGAQSLHTNSRDEALALPTEESARLALRTQQIIAYESGVANTADPAGRQRAIEELTDAIEARCRARYLAAIDGMGGTLRAIETGFIQNEIQNAAYDYQRAVESGEQVVVGVNRFQQEGEARFPLSASIRRWSRRRSNACARCALRGAHRRWRSGLRARTGGAGRVQPDAADSAGRKRLRHGGRDFRPPARHFWRISRPLSINQSPVNRALLG